MFTDFKTTDIHNNFSSNTGLDDKQYGILHRALNKCDFDTEIDNVLIKTRVGITTYNSINS
jgi:hypothetical protein